MQMSHFKLSTSDLFITLDCLFVILFKNLKSFCFIKKLLHVCISQSSILDIHTINYLHYNYKFCNNKSLSHVLNNKSFIISVKSI